MSARIGPWRAPPCCWLPVTTSPRTCGRRDRNACGPDSADLDGRAREFRFSGLEARRWSLYVRAPGFVPFVQRVSFDDSVLEARIDAPLLPAAILRGHVTDPKGGSLRGVTVRLSSMDPIHTLEYPDPRTRTDARGRFELGQVAAGEYWLEAYAADGRMSATKLQVKNAEPLVRDLQLSPPDDPGTVRLRVMDDAGRPVAGAWVAGTGPEHHTDAAGRCGAHGVTRKTRSCR